MPIFHFTRRAPALKQFEHGIFCTLSFLGSFLTEAPFRVLPVVVQTAQLPKLVVSPLLRTPGHIHTHWNVVLDRHRQ